MARVEARPVIQLACTECKQRNYSERTRRRPNRIELLKYCPRRRHHPPPRGRVTVQHRRRVAELAELWSPKPVVCRFESGRACTHAPITETTSIVKLHPWPPPRAPRFMEQRQWSELKKVSWPTIQQTRSLTFAVSFAVMVFVSVADTNYFLRCKWSFLSTADDDDRRRQYRNDDGSGARKAPGTSSIPTRATRTRSRTTSSTASSRWQWRQAQRCSSRWRMRLKITGRRAPCQGLPRATSWSR